MSPNSRDSSAVRALGPSVLFRVFFRSFFLQAAWNPQGMQNLGLVYTLYPALRKLYLERFGEHCRTLKERVRGMSADYHRVSTAVPADRALLGYLATRAARKGVKR